MLMSGVISGSASSILSQSLMYFDAKDTSYLTVSTSNTVSNWRDWYNRLNATQTTPANQPSSGDSTKFIGGNNALGFTGAQELLLPNGSMPTGDSQYEIFIVGKHIAEVTAMRYITSGTNLGTKTQNPIIYVTTGVISNGWGGSPCATPASSVVLNTPSIIDVSYNGASRTIYINNVNKVNVVGNLRNNDSNMNYIGSGGGINYLQGAIGSIIVYNQALNTSQRNTVYNYLKTRWNL